MQANVGLVGVDLRRRLGREEVPGRCRVWDDLFQEGCLGLIRAARSYRSGCGIPFSTFALPRIRKALDRALARGVDPESSAAGLGPRRRRGDRRRSRVKPVGLVRLTERMARILRDRRRHDPFVESGDTIGGRLREKYERAVRDAGRKVRATPSRRGDRGRLVRALTEQRLLVAEEPEKTPLRRIAAETGSSFSRVKRADEMLRAMTGKWLDGDPEFAALRRFAGKDPEGEDAPIDDALEARLAHTAADAFFRRFDSVHPVERGRMLLALLRETRLPVRVFAPLFRHLSSEVRERLTRHSVGCGTAMPGEGSATDQP